MQFVSRASGASGASVPESPSDFPSTCKVVVANFAAVSPADADHVDRKLLGLVLAHADTCDSDCVLLGAVVDVELKAHVCHFARGTKDCPLPDVAERVCSHARRVDRRSRERAARDVRDFLVFFWGAFFDFLCTFHSHAVFDFPVGTTLGLLTTGAGSGATDAVMPSCIDLDTTQ